MKEIVRERYAAHARELPDADDGAPPSLGVGDAVTLAALRPGETVLDLGSGSGHDLLAAARAVGPAGRAIGVDMTPEMIGRARVAAGTAGLDNVAVLPGDLEHLPVHCGAVDVVISNCVINLVPDKERALREAYRALRPGGRLAILDTAFDEEPPSEIRTDPDAWSCCVGGSLVIDDYARLLRTIGFEDVSLDTQDASCGEACSSGGVTARSVAVTATKPGASEPALRPAVASDRPAIDALLTGAGLPTTGLHIEDAVVALSGGRVAGVVALERFGPTSLLRSLAVDPAHQRSGTGTRLVIAALEIARWSGAEEIYLFTENAMSYFERSGFVPVSNERARASVHASELVRTGVCSAAPAMRLSFEEADLPLLGKPSVKPLPLFGDGACC